MNSWKKKFKKGLDTKLEEQTPHIESLEKVTPRKSLPLWAKIAIPVGACAALTLAVALPLSLRTNEKSNPDGEVFIKAADKMAQLVKTDSNSANGLSQRHRLSDAEGKAASIEGPAMIYYVGLLLDNNYDVVHTPMHFYASYHYAGEYSQYDRDYDMVIAADLDRSANKLTFYGHQQLRNQHDPTNSTPFDFQGDFVYDVNYDESTDTLYSFRFNVVRSVSAGSAIVQNNDYYEYDGTTYWLSDDGEESTIKTYFAGCFATLQERRAKAVDASGGASIYSEACNHYAELAQQAGLITVVSD
jgi:hypothetical protein